MNLGTLWGQFMEKTRGKKSRATVSLKTYVPNFFLCLPVDQARPYMHIIKKE